MTDEKKYKLFVKLRDLCEKPEIEVIDGFIESKNSEYETAYDVLDETKCFDSNYLENLGDRDGYSMAAHPEGLTFDECCTALTFILRAEHWSEGAFYDALQGGDVYRLLSRMCDLLKPQ